MGDVDIVGEYHGEIYGRESMIVMVGDCVDDVVREIYAVLSSFYDRPIKVVYSTSPTPSRRYSSPI